jgi:hypothetical protein
MLIDGCRVNLMTRHQIRTGSVNRASTRRRDPSPLCELDFALVGDTSLPPARPSARAMRTRGACGHAGLSEWMMTTRRFTRTSHADVSPAATEPIGCFAWLACGFFGPGTRLSHLRLDG